LYSDKNSPYEKKNRRAMRYFLIVFSSFCILMITISIVSYLFAANIFKKQLVLKCETIASTVASVIESDSQSYAEFLNTLDTESEYYKKAKQLMMNIKRANESNVAYVYTEIRVDNDTMMYVIGGEEPGSPMYTPTGVTDKLTAAGREAYDKKTTVTGTQFVTTAYGVRLSAYAPVKHIETGEFLGLVGVDITKNQYNSVMVVFLFQTIASFVLALGFFGVVIFQFSERVQRTINTDALTKLANKSYFKSELKRHLHTNTINYVIMADLDHFKRVNDTYGHEFGDKVLVQTAAQIKKNTRAEDCPARYGGEEFIIYLAGVSSDKAIEIMERIRSQIENMQILHEETGKTVPITISLGAAQIPKGMDVSKAVELADKALYKAKEKRNVCVLQTSVLPE